MADDFLEFSDDDGDESFDFDRYMSVRAFLQAHFGGSLGSRIYRALERNAIKLSEAHGDEDGVPAIIFRGKGGEFAAFVGMVVDGEKENKEQYDTEDEL
jgi:hypothetical protein